MQNQRNLLYYHLEKLKKNTKNWFKLKINQYKVNLVRINKKNANIVKMFYQMLK